MAASEHNSVIIKNSMRNCQEFINKIINKNDYKNYDVLALLRAKWKCSTKNKETYKKLILC